MAIDNFYNEVLTEHNIRPEYKYDLHDADLILDGVNPSCGDEITLKVKYDGNIITEAAFTGDGCAISQASCDIMASLITGKTKEEALKLADIFTRMIKDHITDEELEELEEAGALIDVSHMPSRVKCAVLGWHTLEEMFDQLKEL